MDDRRAEVNDLVDRLVGGSRPSSTGPGIKGTRPNSVMSAPESNTSDLISSQ